MKKALFNIYENLYFSILNRAYITIYTYLHTLSHTMLFYNFIGKRKSKTAAAQQKYENKQKTLA